MRCAVYPVDTLKAYKYVVIFPRYRGKWVFCKHKKRDTWETAGGHIEPGETPLEAAKRELYEETGAILYDIAPICDYWASDKPEKTPSAEASGVIYIAHVHSFGDMPESEMEKTGLFDALPDNLTYPGITPVLFPHAQAMANETYITMGDVDESISIMREAAGWLADMGKPMWQAEELDSSVLKNPPGEFIVMYDSNHESIATLLLSFEDRFFWPDIPPNESGFIHKLAIRRKYAGKGHAKKLIDYAVSLCRARGIMSIRLDCDSGRNRLCGFYENAGFGLVEKKTLDTKKFGKIDVSYYMLDIM